MCYERHTVEVSLEHTASWRALSLVSRYGDTAGIVNESSKGCSPFFQSTCLRIMDNLVKQVNSKSMGTMAYFTYCEESSLILNNPMWNTVTMAKTASPQMVTSQGLFAEK